MKRTFRNWLVSEGKDIFGFEGGKREVPEPVDESPIVPVGADHILEFMHTRTINGQECFSNYHDHVQWGRHPGAVQMVISPLGSFKSIIRKLQTDLLGEAVWICKEIVPYKDMLKASPKLDESVAENIFERIEEHWKGELEAPSGEYDGLERLAVRLAESARRPDNLPELLVYRGVRRVKKDEHYDIHFEMRGHGVEAPGSARVEQFSIELAYDRQRGMIKCFGHDIQSPTKGHKWYPQPSEWDEMFSPSQDEKEIVSCVCSAFRTY